MVTFERQTQSAYASVWLPEYMYIIFVTDELRLCSVFRDPDILFSREQDLHTVCKDLFVAKMDWNITLRCIWYSLLQTLYLISTGT